jgi:hypothetical protein
VIRDGDEGLGLVYWRCDIMFILSLNREVLTMADLVGSEGRRCLCKVSAY